MRRMLVGVDGSACSGNALHCAALLAKPWDAQVIATTVWAPRAHASVSVLADERNSLRRLMEDEWCAPARSASVDIECQVVDGETPDALLDLADAKGVDLITLGRRGSGGFAGLHLGSVVDAVANRTERPLLVVPARASPHRVRKIVVGVDGSSGADAALRLVAELVARMHVPVHVVYAFQPLFEWLPESNSSSWHTRSQEMLDRIWTKPLRDAGNAVSTALVTSNHVTDVLLDQVAHQQADLLVVGTRDGGLSAFRLGGVATQLLHHADVPLLLVPPTSSAR